MNNELIYDIVKQGEGMEVNNFLSYLSENFNLPVHKWSVFDDENAPLFDASEKVIFNNDGYEVLTFDLDSYDNVGYIKYINYELLL